jgi:hypothetical protein
VAAAVTHLRYLNLLLPDRLGTIRQGFASITVFLVTLRECRRGHGRARTRLLALIPPRGSDGPRRADQGDLYARFFRRQGGLAPAHADVRAARSDRLKARRGSGASLTSGIQVPR